MGRCLNDRLREHCYILRCSPSGHLACHCDRCGCSPSIGPSEAFQINTLGGNCISAPLIELHELLFECSWWWFCGKGPARAPFNWLWRFPAFNLFNKFSRTSLPTSTLSVFLCAISINKTAIQTQRILINNVFIHVGHSMMATFSLRACRHWRLSCPQVCRIGERSSPVQFSFRLRTH